MKQLTELKKQYEKLGNEIKKLEEKPKVKTVRELEGTYRHKFFRVLLNDDLAKPKAYVSEMLTGTDYKPSIFDFIDKKEAEKFILRMRIECELDCDSRIAWGGIEPGISVYYIEQFGIRFGNQLILKWHDFDCGWIIGLFGAVNFPTKESLIESINEVKEDANGKSFTIRELLNQYFDVKKFEVV